MSEEERQAEIAQITAWIEGERFQGRLVAGFGHQLALKKALLTKLNA